MRKAWLLHVLVLLAIAAIACGPLALAIGAGLVADAAGCTLHEGFVNPCVIAGTDYGDTLYALGMMGWLAIASLPIGLILLAVYLVIVLVVWLVRRSRANTPSS